MEPCRRCLFSVGFFYVERKCSCVKLGENFPFLLCLLEIFYPVFPERELLMLSETEK